MGGGRSFRRGLKKSSAVSAPAFRLDGLGKWGVFVGPGIWVATESATPPSRWHRFWQRVLLGFRWEQR